MKKVIFLILTINCSLLSVHAQTQFQQSIGGTGNDVGYSIKQTTDGGYVIGGYTASFGLGSYDMYIVKINAGGTLQWSKTVGGAGNEWIWSIIQTTDGGFAMVGGTSSFGAGGFDLYIVKLDGSGTLLWSRTVGGTGNEYDHSSIIQTTDGGYAVAGMTTSFGAGNSDMYIVKLDAGGILQWSRTVGGTSGEEAYSIIQTTDGGYAVIGYTGSFGAGSLDMYIVKFDAGGTLQWSKTVGGTGYDFAYSIIQTTDGGYAVAGHTTSFGTGSADMYIVKLDGSGTLLWSRTAGGTGSEEIYSIIQTTDGGYTLVGYTNSFGAGSNDFYIVKLDASGVLLSSKTIGGTGDDVPYSIKHTSDGGFVIAGITNSFGSGGYDMYIVKLDASGNTCGNSTSPTSISGTGGTVGSPTSTLVSPTSTVTSPPSLTSSGGIVTTICTFTGLQHNTNETPNSFSLLQNYPNPFNPETNVKFQITNYGLVTLKIYNVLGIEAAVLVNENLQTGSYKVNWNASNYPSGVYYYKLSSGEFSQTNKMILIK